MACTLCGPPASGTGGFCCESWRTGRLGALGDIKDTFCPYSVLLETPPYIAVYGQQQVLLLSSQVPAPHTLHRTCRGGHGSNVQAAPVCPPAVWASCLYSPSAES